MGIASILLALPAEMLITRKPLMPSLSDGHLAAERPPLPSRRPSAFGTPRPSGSVSGYT